MGADVPWAPSLRRYRPPEMKVSADFWGQTSDRALGPRVLRNRRLWPRRVDYHRGWCRSRHCRLGRRRLDQLGALQANRKAEKERDEEDRVAREKAKLITAQFQCSLILSDVTATVASINFSLIEANERGLTSQPLFTRLMPVIGNMATRQLILMR